MIWIFKLGRMGWEGNVTHMGEKRNLDRILWSHLKKQTTLENLGADERMTLNCIFNMLTGCGLDFVAQERDNWQAI
jgi:hypothetical protein